LFSPSRLASLHIAMALLTETMRERLRERLTEAVAEKEFQPKDVSAGREYIKAYVEFIHYVERLYEASR